MIRTQFWRHALLALVMSGVTLDAATAFAQTGAPAPEADPRGPEATTTPAEPASAPATEASVTAQPALPEPTLAPASSPEAMPPTGSTQAPTVEAPRARLDYSDGSFYLRSDNDNIVLVPGGRAHIDTYSFAGKGVSDYHRSNGTGLKTNLFFRRFVIEMGGLIRKQWFFWMGGNFAPTQVDDKQAPISTANVYDGFIGYMPTPRLRIYAGMYNAPFTMENVTSSRWLDLMERALLVRTLATPYNKAEGLMFWGDTENKSFEYQVGVFGGDGMNRPNVDNRFDGMGRFVVRPLAKREDALKRLHIGVGARLGSRDNSFVQYDAPNLSTPGGYAFWSSSYKDSVVPTTTVHIRPSSRQTAVSGEFYVPFERWDVRGEALYLNEGRREDSETEAKVVKTERYGTLKGFGAYGQLSFWLLGTPRINGNPAGAYGVLKLPDNLGTQAPSALQLVVRGELMRLTYDGNARSGSDPTGLSNQTQDIKVNAYQLALNYWATKHVRLSAEYSLYHFPGSTGSNQALAPGAKAKTEPDAKALNELSFRVGLAL